METLGYCVRVQALEGYLEKVRALTFKDDYTAILAVRHNGGSKENPHYHLVVKTTIEPQTFRKRMKVVFPDGKGNGHMSIVPWDGSNDALSYLFHEEPDVEPLVRKNVSDELLARLRDRNNQVLAEVQKAKSKASHTLEEDGYQWCVAKGLKRPPDAVLGARLICLALRLGKYPPQPWLVRAMVVRIKWRLLDGDEDAEEAYCNELSNNIFRG